MHRILVLFLSFLIETQIYMRTPDRILLYVIPFLLLFSSCQTNTDHENIDSRTSAEKMVDTLKYLEQNIDPATNYYASEKRIVYLQNRINQSQDPREKGRLTYAKIRELINAGKNEDAINTINQLLQQLQIRPEAMDKNSKIIYHQLALAYLRIGEVTNCVANHSAESCIMPIQGGGIHQFPEGSQNAIDIYTHILNAFPDDLYARWLLNIAYMTLGQYPDQVPPKWQIPGLKPKMETNALFFPNKSMGLGGIDINGVSGGCVIEDFNNDGFLDIMASQWCDHCQVQLFLNDGKGSYHDQTAMSGLSGITGGLNMIHGDYNNDGFADVLVLRGAWLEDNGALPNSLLKNNGDGTFEDVTFESKLLSFHPSQTAVMADFNNDGWIDIFIANEQAKNTQLDHSCELFINQKDGTFSEIGKSVGITMKGYFKGVTAGDVNNDGWIDLYLSNLDGQNYLLLNNWQKNQAFEDITLQSGVSDPPYSFPTWFWDYNNDGWMDLFVCGYDYRHMQQAGSDVAIDLLNLDDSDIIYPKLYKNNGDNTFTDVTEAAGFKRVIYGMGANYGDLNNDGFLDCYLGTGTPDLRSVVPNVALLNHQGTHFEDITFSSGLAHLQKGHGVGFGDMDNDGDQDIYTVMGGAYSGDFFHNAFFENPTEGSSWITLSLEGTTSNKMAIGSRIKVMASYPDGSQQSFYRAVGTGGSFGSSSMQQEIGLGNANKIEELEIVWANADKTTQTFNNLKLNTFYKIKEGQNKAIQQDRKKIVFEAGMHHH